MPTIEVSRKDISKLVGKNLARDELAGLLHFAKSTLEGGEGDTLKVEASDVNRPDLWSSEGIARVIKGQLGRETGMPKYQVSSSSYVVKVESKVKKVRPIIVCAALKGVQLDEEAIKQLIQLQEKLCENFGLKRKEAALGIYDLDKIKWPVTYTSFPPNSLKFIPLDMKEELSLQEILQRNEKGRQYAPLLAGAKEYPILIDAGKQVLSMPPVINSDYTGKVTEKTKNVFVEVTGYDYRFAIPVLNIMVSALAERGGKIHSVTVHGEEKVITPYLAPVKVRISADYCNKILGLQLKSEDIVKLLRKARYDAKVFGEDILVEYLPYRQDVMDARDIIEDIAIAYGYMNFKPEKAEIATIGKQLDSITLKEKLIEILIGLGMQETATFTLGSKENLFKKMNLQEHEVIEILNPVSANYSCLRDSLLPSSLEFLSRNIKKEFPQKIFEFGECFSIQENKTKSKLVIAISHKDANFTEIKQVLDYLMKSINAEYKISEVKHDSFIEGRTGEIIPSRGKESKESREKSAIGIIGEINPKVLSSWKLEMPVSALEIDLEPFPH